MLFRSHAKPTINKSSCSVVFRATGPAIVGDGRGAYKGISGTLKITVTFAGVLGKTAKGCTTLSNAPLHGMYTSITGSGKVKFIK